MALTDEQWDDLKARYLRWVNHTFPDETPAQQATHLAKELDEFFNSKSREEMVGELADVMMMLWCVTNRVIWLKVNNRVSAEELKEAIEVKLKINMSRKWKRTSDGDYQHED